jgi:hypothetical protein
MWMDTSVHRALRGLGSRWTLVLVTAGACAAVGIGAGGAPAASSGTPGFVQQVNKRANAGSVALQPVADVTAGDRLVVEVGVWSSGGATTSGITDSAGNTYTRLTTVKASDKTELSVWSAPVTAGGGTGRPSP